ncbi:hypothetical protein ILYODFUR_006402 [Ilyodon furcidens]|uniref:Uncharacterized protein n=1 Tax=Ilyodon furcidens TaxID=33524 RepID=A0ABV0SUP4_9TELE
MTSISLGRVTKPFPKLRDSIKPRRASGMQVIFNSVNVRVHHSTTGKRLGSNGIQGRVPRPKPLLTKKTKEKKRAISHLPKNVRRILKPLGKYFVDWQEKV